jgi:hypothetical protein
MDEPRHGGFKMRADCRHCGHPVPLNVPVEAIHCTYCQNDARVPEAMWRATLRELDEHHDALASGAAVSRTQDFDGLIVHFSYRRTKPCCEKCGADYPADRIDDGQRRDLFCVTCGDAASTWPAPAWLTRLVPNATQVLSTEPGMGAPPGGRPIEVPDAPRPVVMQCPSCGGPLRVTAESPRTVRCEHCASDVYLPDDLWRRLHPAKTVREWYVRFEGKTDKQRAEEDRRARAAASAAEHARLERERLLLAEEAARRLDAEVDAAKRTAYVWLLVLYTFMGATLLTFLLALGGHVDLPLRGTVFGVLVGAHVVLIWATAVSCSRPLAKRLSDKEMNSSYWVWVIFGHFIFPFSPVVFVAGLLQFFGSFSASAKLKRRESWPAAWLFVAMSLVIGAEFGVWIAYDAHASSAHDGKPTPGATRKR